MSYRYLHNKELEASIETYIDAIKNTQIELAYEEISTVNSLDRITSSAVYALISSPHYNACAMDGIALLASKTFGATDTTPVELTENIDFVWVDTGDPLPENYDSVVMVEDVIDLGDGKIKLVSAASPWQHIRQIGEDICQGEIILPTNTKIGPSSIGAMLAGGVLTVQVKKKLVVGIIPTGDEIVHPTSNPKSGEIIEFNSSVFSAMLTKWGATPKAYDIVKDNLNSIKSVIQDATSECDIVLINAGSSAGRDDYSTTAINELGQMLIHGIAIKPGKPAILGLVNSRPVIGIPGYPVSGIIVMEKIVKPVLEFIQGVSVSHDKTTNAVLSRKIVSSLKYKEFIRVNLAYINDNFAATPLSRGAGVITSFSKADGILEIPMNSEGFERNTQVNVQLLRDEADIKNTISVVGSHDPLIDIVGDLVRKSFPTQFISSSHVGSMGGILAIQRKEAHIAGIHLLDEKTGKYNSSYINKYLKNENIATIKCVKRIQGLIVEKGNPKGIKSLSDIAANGFSYVNRQKGSGTRILLDYLLKKDNIKNTDIYGYEREEFTHMSVAALINSKSADCGLGIYSVANIYDLDFIPVFEEEYDFIIPKNYLELEKVKNFINILQSDEFKNILNNMGGYIVEEPGRIII